MDTQDRQAIERLFGRLAETEKTAAPRDGEAEALIRDLMWRQPQAAYYMAQTIIMQQKALEEAEYLLDEAEGGRRREQYPDELRDERYRDDRRPEERFSDDRFGGDDRGYDRPPPDVRTSGGFGRRGGFSVPPMPRQSATTEPRQASGGGGFLAGAAQTAMGVAGGVLLGNVIGGMFGLGGGHAQAAEDPAKPDAAQEHDTPAADQPTHDQAADAGGDGGGGFWDSLFGGGSDGPSGGDAGDGDFEV